MSIRINEANMRSMLNLYLVLGSVNCRLDPLVVLEQAIHGGITLFQFREKGSGACIGASKVELAKQMRYMCRQHHIPFIVNDDVELALEVDADGVHVGQEDESVVNVRRQIGNKILGVSAHNVEEARQAIAYGADYLGVGPMYATLTKADAREVQGPSIIRAMRQQGIDVPLVGIGGITLQGALPVMEAGADGIAVISAITQAEHPAEAARLLREQCQNR